ncbi:MAG: hypothetical protein ACF8TS_15510 [Maioricimonas sp. JB049]
MPHDEDPKSGQRTDGPASDVPAAERENRNGGPASPPPAPDASSMQQLVEGSKQLEYALREYTSLRQEILERIERIEGQLRYGLVTSGGIWAWTLTHPEPNWYGIVVWIPAAVVGVFFFMWVAQHFAISGISKYIREQLEPRLKLPYGVGWESQVVKYQLPLLRSLTSATWLVLLAVNIGAACVAASWEDSMKGSAADARAETVPDGSESQLRALKQTR